MTVSVCRREKQPGDDKALRKTEGKKASTVYPQDTHKKISRGGW